MNSLRTLALLCAAPAGALGWIAAGPVANGAVNLFQLNDGVKGKDVFSIKVGPGEQLESNALTCGRCFCLLLTQSPAAKTSTLYNVSFCPAGVSPGAPPAPGLNSKLTVPAVTTNLHSNYGEGDGGNGYSLTVDTTSTPPAHKIVMYDGSSGPPGSIVPVVDITAHLTVNGEQGQVFPGATAFCPESNTMWVGVDAPHGANDVLLTIDLQSKAVSSVPLHMPISGGLFANCAKRTAGGIFVMSNGPGRKSVVMGEYDATGGFKGVDSFNLPRGSTLDMTGIVDTILWQSHPDWNQNVGAVLLSTDADGKQSLPGAVFTSTAEKQGKPGAAVLSPLNVAVAAIAVEY
jgi:hypothetical protein